MAWDDPISIKIDCAQPRPIKDRNIVFCQGAYPGVNGKVLGWDLSRSTGVAVDRATFTAFLGPYQQSEEWYSTFTGNYTRMAKSDWTLSESAKWKEDETNAAGDIWLHAADLTANSTGITTTAYAKNRGFYVAYFDYSATGEENAVLECGWNSSASPASGVSFKVFSSGRVTIYKDGEYLGWGSISDDQSTQQKWVSFLVLPGRHQELMFIPNQGKGFTFEFPELAGEADPTITGATKFWFRCPRPTGHAMKLQIAPLTFPESGMLIAERSYFARPPEDTDDLYPVDIYWHEAYAGTTDVELMMVETDDLDEEFEADGVKDECFCRFDLEGDGEYTPFVYAGIAGFDVVRGETSDVQEAELLDVTTDRCLRIGETPDSHNMELHCVGLPALVSAGVVDPIGHANRPVSLSLAGFTLFEGLTLPVEVESAPDEAAYGISYKVAPYWKLLEDYVLTSPVPLDGSSFDLAIKFFGKGALGFQDSQLNVPDEGIVLGDLGAPSSGEWATMAEVGDRGSDWIEDLFDMKAGNWFFDILPDWADGGTELLVLPPEDMPDTAVVTLWGTVEEAIAQLVFEGETESDAEKFYAHRLWQNYNERQIAAEANEIHATGMHPRTGQPFQSRYIDHDAQDPTLDPDERPDNWAGYPLKYGIGDPILCSQSDTDTAVELLADRLTPKRRLCSFDNPQMIRISSTGRPIWKPDLVILKNVYDGEDVTVRISGFETDFDCEGEWPWMSRPSSYFGEIISGATAWRGSLRATNLKQAAAIAKERARILQNFKGVYAMRVRQGRRV
ncbi:MAG: hypothetical protein JNK63_02430 [Chthonomonas sp.]|nr:hypothetical protein [Chthonomonas sp.]